MTELKPPAEGVALTQVHRWSHPVAELTQGMVGRVRIDLYGAGTMHRVIGLRISNGMAYIATPAGVWSFLPVTARVTLDDAKDPIPAEET